MSCWAFVGLLVCLQFLKKIPWKLNAFTLIIKKGYITGRYIFSVPKFNYTILRAVAKKESKVDAYISDNFSDILTNFKRDVIWGIIF